MSCQNQHEIKNIFYFHHDLLQEEEKYSHQLRNFFKFYELKFKKTMA